MDITGILLSLLTLTLLEIVLGIDNLVFIAIVSNRLPLHQQKTARRLGLFLALAGRLTLLGMVSLIIKLDTPLFSVFSNEFSGRDIFMVVGGLFLLAKGTWEIHHALDPNEKVATGKSTIFRGFSMAIVQIIIFDIIFSLDSILTAVGLTTQLWIMAVAIIIAIILMIIASEPLSSFIERHPTVKMLALSFLLLIGMVLVADGFGVDIPKGYIYFSIFFSLLVEALNSIRAKRFQKKS